MSPPQLPPSGIERLLAIMAALRDPAHGCPWDIEQDFTSIAPYTVEEAYEVADAIRRDDMVDLKDELGDLLLQPVYHAQMAAEAGHFVFADVIEAICNKLIRRHPHVFGERQADNPGTVKALWDAIKAEEKAERATARKALGLRDDTPKGQLGGVKTSLPGLMRAFKLQAKASEVGFDWNDARLVLDKIIEEANEVRDALDHGKQAAIEDEIGDLFFAVVNLARHAKADPEACLLRANEKFIRRFGAIETALAAKGRTLGDASLDEMEALWVAAKRQEAS